MVSSIGRLSEINSDLLAAAQRAEYRLSAMAGDGVTETLDMLRAAIAKAEGK